MTKYVSIIAAAIAGIFATVTAVIAWKLKSKTDARERSIAIAKQRRDEVKRLYTDVFVVVEQTINRVRQFEEFNLDKELSDVNGRVCLLAHERVAKQYVQVASLLTEWSILFANASPKRTKVGDQTMVFLQAPDPTAKYKEPEREASQKLQGAVDLLIKEMRAELANDA